MSRDKKEFRLWQKDIGTKLNNLSAEDSYLLTTFQQSVGPSL